MNEQQQPEDSPNQPRTDRQTYNVISDTVTGPNVRFKDNLYQGLAILICIALGAGIDFLITGDGLFALVGGFVGLLVGFFGSGIFLMIYRGVKHARGEHD